MKPLLKLSSFLAIAAGIILIFGGIWGISFTYQNITREKIVTPPDASIPNTPVSDPLTLRSQADIIRTHVMKMSGGKTYSEMPHQIASVDAFGKAILDKDGKPVMVPNTTRDLWVTATTLTTALNLGILTYAFSTFTILIGFISVWTGIVFLTLSKSASKKR